MGRTTAVLAACLLSLSLTSCTVRFGPKPPEPVAIEQRVQPCPVIRPDLECSDPPRLEGERVEGKIKGTREDLSRFRVKAVTVIRGCQGALDTFYAEYDDCVERIEKLNKEKRK